MGISITTVFDDDDFPNQYGDFREIVEPDGFPDQKARSLGLKSIMEFVDFSEDWDMDYVSAEVGIAAASKLIEAFKPLDASEFVEERFQRIAEQTKAEIIEDLELLVRILKPAKEAGVKFKFVQMW